jgi:hypothetical protein
VHAALYVFTMVVNQPTAPKEVFDVAKSNEDIITIPS